MEDVVTRAQARPRFLTLLLSLFFRRGTGDPTVGIYGVVSYSVASAYEGIWPRMVLAREAATSSDW